MCCRDLKCKAASADHKLNDTEECVQGQLFTKVQEGELGRNMGSGVGTRPFPLDQLAQHKAKHQNLVSLL